MDNPPKLDSLADYVLKRNRNPREDGQLRERLDVIEAWLSEMRKLWRFPVLPGPDITITGGKVVGRDGSKILVFDGGGNQVAEFQASAAGLTAAVALAGSGDLIQIPPCDFTYTGAITIASGVHLRGYYLSSMIRDIAIAVAAGGVVSDLQWTGNNAGGYAASIAGTVYHSYIWGPTNGTSVFMIGGTLMNSVVAVCCTTQHGVGFSASCYGKVIDTHIYLAAALVASTALFVGNGASPDYDIWIIGVTTEGCNSGFDCRGGGTLTFIKDCLFTGTGYGGGFGQAGGPVCLNTHFKATGPGAYTDLVVDSGSTPTFIGVTWGSTGGTGAFTYGESDRAKADHAHAAYATLEGGAAFNDAGAATADFRVESDNYDALFVDASNDSIALMNNASGKLGLYAATPVVKPSALTAQLTTLTHTAPGTPDYAIQDLTNVAPFGFVTKDEGNSVLAVVVNLQTRVSELESKLKSLGALA